LAAISGVAVCGIPLGHNIVRFGHGQLRLRAQQRAAKDVCPQMTTDLSHKRSFVRRSAWVSHPYRWRFGSFRPSDVVNPSFTGADKDQSVRMAGANDEPVPSQTVTNATARHSKTDATCPLYTAQVRDGQNRPLLQYWTLPKQQGWPTSSPHGSHMMLMLHGAPSHSRR
jgi:hypothetical protein